MSSQEAEMRACSRKRRAQTERLGDIANKSCRLDKLRIVGADRGETQGWEGGRSLSPHTLKACLLYTSDAADECVNV